jgi:toxin ParE1/3/4
MVTIIWSPLAIERLHQIFDYISQDSVQEARKFNTLIFKSVEKIGFFPKMGRVVPERNQEEIREILVKKYRVIYKIKADLIGIMTIIQGSKLLFFK